MCAAQTWREGGLTIVGVVVIEWKFCCIFLIPAKGHKETSSLLFRLLYPTYMICLPFFSFFFSSSSCKIFFLFLMVGRWSGSTGQWTGVRTEKKERKGFEEQWWHCRISCEKLEKKREPVPHVFSLILSSFFYERFLLSQIILFIENNKKRRKCIL